MSQQQALNKNREPICCPVTGHKLSYIDWERKKLYEWCKCASCKGWHEYDLEAMEREYKARNTQAV